MPAPHAADADPISQPRSHRICSRCVHTEATVWRTPPVFCPLFALSQFIKASFFCLMPLWRNKAAPMAKLETKRRDSSPKNLVGRKSPPFAFRAAGASKPRAGRRLNKKGRPGAMEQVLHLRCPKRGPKPPRALAWGPFCRRSVASYSSRCPPALFSRTASRPSVAPAPL